MFVLVAICPKTKRKRHRKCRRRGLVPSETLQAVLGIHHDKKLSKFDEFNFAVPVSVLVPGTILVPPRGGGGVVWEAWDAGLHFALEVVVEEVGELEVFDEGEELDVVHQ